MVPSKKGKAHRYKFSLGIDTYMENFTQYGLLFLLAAVNDVVDFDLGSLRHS